MIVDPHNAVIHLLAVVFSDVAVLLSWLPLDFESDHIII